MSTRPLLRTALFLLVAGAAGCGMMGSEDDGVRAFHESNKTKAMVDQAERSLRTGDVHRARNDLEALGGADALDPVARLLYARTLIADGRFAECEEVLAALAAQNPDAHGVDLVRGTLEEARGRWQSARVAYAQAAEKNPTSIRPILMQVRTFHATGDPAGAAALLERELARHPGLFELQLALGDAYLANGDPRLAIAYYREALDHDQRNDAVRAKAAFALALAGEHRQAMDLVRELPDTAMPPHVRLALARSALAIGEAEKARYWLLMYLDRFPNESGAWVDLARSHFLLNDFDPSLEALRHALAIDPGRVDALVLLGHLRANAGQASMAVNTYLEAIRLGADAAPLAPLIEALIHQGDAEMIPVDSGVQPVLPASRNQGG